MNSESRVWIDQAASAPDRAEACSFALQDRDMQAIDTCAASISQDVSIRRGRLAKTMAAGLKTLQIFSTRHREVSCLRLIIWHGVIVT